MDINVIGPQGIFPDAYKRAVQKRAPSRFSHEPLEPVKIGGNYCYGLRIHPLPDTTSLRSVTGSLNTTYEIWRRWEDCLHLQDLLETEYTRHIKGDRSNRMRKGAMDGHPEAQSVLPLADPWLTAPLDDKHLTDVHVYLPRLTKKGTLFKPSPGLIAQRSVEYHALINALLGEGLPPALRALRHDRVIHDHFGYWRRDVELAEKMIPSPHTGDAPPNLKRPARLNSPVDFVPRPASPVDTSSGTPSLTSGESVDMCSCALPTPSGSQDWSSTLRKVTYPPNLLPDQVLEEDGRGGRTQKMSQSQGLVVQVDTTEETFEDRRARNLTRSDFKYAPFPIPPSPTSPPPLPSPSFASPLIFRAAEPSTHMHESNSAPDLTLSPPTQPTGPVQASVVISDLSSSASPAAGSKIPWAPLRPRLRSASTSAQETPPPEHWGIPASRRIYDPATLEISVSSSRAPPASRCPEGLPAPPPSAYHRSQAGSLTEISINTSLPPLASPARTSGGTFGGASIGVLAEVRQRTSQETSQAYLTQLERRPSAASASEGMSLLSGDLSYPSSADVQQVTERLSQVPSKVVWIKRHPQTSPTASHPAEAPVAVSVNSVVGEAHEPLSADAPVVLAESPDLNALLDMDVNERWWRNKTPSASNPSREGSTHSVLAFKQATPTTSAFNLTPGTSTEAVDGSTASTPAAPAVLKRTSSVSSYAKHVTYTRRSDPRRIHAWAQRIPTGGDLAPEPIVLGVQPIVNISPRVLPPPPTANFYNSSLGRLIPA